MASVRRLSSAPVPTTCFARGTPSRNVRGAPTEPPMCGGDVNASEKPDGLAIFRPFPESENSAIIAPNRTYAPLACFCSLPPPTPRPTPLPPQRSSPPSPPPPPPPLSSTPPVCFTRIYMRKE
ncbi:unnamed protein product [Macrosiphum euphorbiae]|uniref:Uncharacterized protein n=1 Tax=Macrosiphum euphorbiae TaxID=13131 RepID=A0AAV0WZQ5_9HEMI|nr:unnamed protein product [Macrosiphum euphorbiae]